MNKLKDIFLRYLIILLIALPNLFIFYFIFTPLTIYPLFLIFKIFIKDVVLTGHSFILDGYKINLIKACIAGSAYYLLTILNLSIPNVKIKKRIALFLFSFSLLLLLNIIRIFVLTIFFIKDFSSFNIVHEFFWYLGTTLFVVLIWYLSIKKYKIKGIPFYSDIKDLLEYIKKKSH